jgi:peptidoglycan/xylan/chitin deacetylase (PgdA/CDA1 family)
MKSVSDIRVFLFHRVADSKENWAHATSTSIFDKCVRHISKNFTVKTIEECLAMPGKEIANGSKPLACITFDDGFKDNIAHALPVLEKYKCPASFYIVTDCIDSGLPTWPHLVKHLFIDTHKLTLNIDSKYLPGGINETFSGKQERIAYGDTFLQKLLNMPSADAYELFYKVKQNFNDVPAPNKMMMNWDDVRQLSTAGYIIGSHTHSHPLLTKLETDDKVRHEFTHSFARIKEMCGHAPETIAYPLGVANTRIMKLATECGYKYGLTVEQRSYNPSVDDSMAVPRVDMFADSGWLKTYLRLTGRLGTIKGLLGR